MQKRVENGGHDVPQDKIIARYHRTLSILPELIKVSDICNVIDNTKQPFRIFSKKNGTNRLWENSLWKQDDIIKLTKQTDFIEKHPFQPTDEQKATSNLGNSKKLIEKLNILNQESYLNEKKIDVNLRISIIYSGVSSTSQKPILLKDYIKKWLYEVKSNELKPTSFDRKEQTINYQIIPYIGEIPLNKLSSDDVQNMINELKSKYSYSTVKKAYEALNACLKYAVKKKELLYNPADCVSLPKNMEREISRIRYFNDEQIAKIICESIRCYKTGNRVYRMGEIILFLLNTGMRIGEALALKWSDIDFQKQNVKVRRNVVFVKNRDNAKSKNYKYKEQSTKTKSGSRIVPLNSDAMKALISIKVINGKYEYVFSTSKGNRLYPRNVDRMFRSILKNCDIELTGVHTLRHTFASRLFAKGIDVKTVSELLGHSEVGITYDTYIHLIQEQHIAAVETLENVLL